MRLNKNYKFITFHSTSEAMEGERVLLSANISGRIIPVPSTIRAGCGIGWRISLEDYYAEKDKIDTLSLAYEDICDLVM